MYLALPTKDYILHVQNTYMYVDTGVLRALRKSTVWIFIIPATVVQGMQLALNELHILKDEPTPIVNKIARYSTVIHESGRGAEHYMKSRHVYPPELFRFVASLSAVRQKAWDVGTGTGQSPAIGLSPHYNKVIATDISEQQLRHAQPEKNITYLKLPAELTDENIRIHAEHFPRGEIDAITCGTSAHFFDMEKFGRAASQLLRKRTGIVAIFCTVFPLLGDEMNGVFRDLVS